MATRGTLALRLGMLVACMTVLAFVPPSPAKAVDGEITYTGTNTDLVGDDVGAGPFNLGFTFNYYGTNYTQAYVNINGTVTFGSNFNAYSNGALSSSGANNTIYAFWDDLNTNSGRIIYYATVGSSPNRKFVTQWTNIYFHGTTIQMGTFQVILYEGTNEIQLQYRDLLGGDRALGNSATIGIKKDNSTNKQYSNGTASLTQGQAIRYTPNGSNDYTVNTNATYDLVYLAPAGAPTSPTLVNPTGGTTGVTLRPTFEWLPVESATSYTVLVSTVSNFSSTVVNQSGITGTSYTLGSDLSQNTQYYWRVQSVNGSGSSLSSTRTFTTGSLNTAPSTPSSVSSATLTGAVESYDLEDATLTATLADPDDAEQVRYRLQIATDSSFNDLVVDYRSAFAAEGPVTYSYGETGGTYLVGSATTTLPVDSYYLRIRTEDDAAASSAWHTVSGIAFSIIERPADVTAPGISELSVDPEPTSATIFWTTDELASSAIDYGPSSSYTASTTEANTAPRVLEHEVELTGLESCVTYHYRVRSRDASGNQVTSNDGTFTTKGCTGAALVVAQTSSGIASTTGGTIELKSGGKGLSIEVPPAFSSSTLYFQIKKIDEGAVMASTSVPSGRAVVGTYTYELHAVRDNLEIVSEFDEPLTLTLAYGPEDIVDVEESSLAIHRWNGASWQALPNCSVDTSAKTVTCDTDHFSTFALFANPRSDSVSEPSRRERGTSVRARVENLLKVGNVARAEELKSEWPVLFTETPKQDAMPVAAAPVSQAMTARDLWLASEGDDVSALQSLLISAMVGEGAHELARVGATGYFGRYTQQALAEYQKAQQIMPSAGYFGPLTRASMKAAGVTGVWW